MPEEKRVFGVGGTMAPVGRRLEGQSFLLEGSPHSFHVSGRVIR